MQLTNITNPTFDYMGETFTVLKNAKVKTIQDNGNNRFCVCVKVKRNRDNTLADAYFNDYSKIPFSVRN